jgi:hypothetical protein
MNIYASATEYLTGHNFLYIFLQVSSIIDGLNPQPIQSKKAQFLYLLLYKNLSIYNTLTTTQLRSSDPRYSSS